MYIVAALSMWGKVHTVSEVVRSVVRDRPFFERSGGGVTVPGGEPLSQPQFTFALLRACKDEGLHTALDTTGFAPWSAVEAVLPYVDLFLLDLKGVDGAAHERIVGVSNEPTLARGDRALRRQDTESQGDSGGGIQSRHFGAPAAPQEG